MDLSDRLGEICRYKEQSERKKRILRKISKDCKSRCDDDEATKMIYSSRFTDKRARRKRGKASAVSRTFPCKESFSSLGGQGRRKNTENRKRFPEFGQACGKGLNERGTGRLQCSSIIPQDNRDSRHVTSKIRRRLISRKIITRTFKSGKINCK